MNPQRQGDNPASTNDARELIQKLQEADFYATYYYIWRSSAGASAM